jgi:hypothetical protein
MDEKRLNRMTAGIDPWLENFGAGMEHRGRDGMSWYDLSINCNSAPCETDLAIIVTSWYGQLKWLKKVLANYRLSGAFVILAYDNPFYAWSEMHHAAMVRTMPQPAHYVLANAVVHKHITYDADKRNGWFWDVRYAQGILKQFPNIKYVYCTNGDCICEKPEGFRDLIKLLGEADIMAGQSDQNKVHTADYLCKAEAFHKLFDTMAEEMRVPVIGSRSPEGMMIEAIRDLRLKLIHPPQTPVDPIDGSVDFYSRYDQPSTFKDLLGYRNLYAIQEQAWQDGLEPLTKEYLDNYENWAYFSGEERSTICKYYETGDRRYLMQYWDCGEDSWYNRLYMPLEAYGEKPIYESETGAVHRI